MSGTATHLHRRLWLWARSSPGFQLSVNSTLGFTVETETLKLTIYSLTLTLLSHRNKLKWNGSFDHGNHLSHETELLKHVASISTFIKRLTISSLLAKLTYSRCSINIYWNTFANSLCGFEQALSLYNCSFPICNTKVESTWRGFKKSV